MTGYLAELALGGMEQLNPCASVRPNALGSSPNDYDSRPSIRAEAYFPRVELLDLVHVNHQCNVRWLEEQTELLLNLRELVPHISQSFNLRSDFVSCSAIRYGCKGSLLTLDPVENCYYGLRWAKSIQPLEPAHFLVDGVGPGLSHELGTFYFFVRWWPDVDQPGIAPVRSCLQGIADLVGEFINSGTHCPQFVYFICRKRDRFRNCATGFGPRIFQRLRAHGGSLLIAELLNLPRPFRAEMPFSTVLPNVTQLAIGQTHQPPAPVAGMAFADTARAFALGNRHFVVLDQVTAGHRRTRDPARNEARNVFQFQPGLE